MTKVRVKLPKKETTMSKDLSIVLLLAYKNNVGGHLASYDHKK